MDSMTGMHFQGTKLDYSKMIETFHINVWKCQNKYDTDGVTPIGIIDGYRNTTEGIDYIPGKTCADDDEITKHLEEFGYIQIMYAG